MIYIDSLVLEIYNIVLIKSFVEEDGKKFDLREGGINIMLS